MGIFNDLKNTIIETSVYIKDKAESSIREHGFIDSFRPKKIVENAKKKYEWKNQELNYSKTMTKLALKEYAVIKLDLWANQFTDFKVLMSGIYNININNKGKIKNNKLGRYIYNIQNNLFEDYKPSFNDIYYDMEDRSGIAIEIATKGALSAGTGALVSIGAYNTVSMLGSASTGTAISTLYGIAESNASLAWLGGGSLATGGGGVAKGSIVLGNIFLISTAAMAATFIAGGYIKSLSEANEIYKETMIQIDEMDKAIYLLNIIKDISDNYTQVSKDMEIILDRILNILEEVNGEEHKLQSDTFMYKIQESLKKIIPIETKINYNHMQEENKILFNNSFKVFKQFYELLNEPLFIDSDMTIEESIAYLEEKNRMLNEFIAYKNEYILN